MDSNGVVDVSNQERDVQKTSDFHDKIEILKNKLFWDLDSL